MKSTERPQYITQLNAFHRWLGAHYLPANAKLLWFMLIGLCNAGGWEEWMQFDNLMLMHLVGTANEKTAIRARQDLIDAGLLVYEKGRKGLPGRYRLLWFPNQSGRESGSVNDSKNDRENSREYDGSMTGNTTGIHTSYKETDKEKDIDKTRENAARVPAELEDVFSAYADMRRKMRKPLTAQATELVLHMLQTLAPDHAQAQRQILQQSILNGWAGVYPLKKDEAPEPPASYDIGEFERRLLYGKIEYKKRGERNMQEGVTEGGTSSPRTGGW